MIKQGRTNKALKGKTLNVEELLSSFDRYLENTQGLAPRTREFYCGYIKSFLQIQFKSKNINIDRLHSKDIIKFILSYKKEGGAKRAQAMTYSLRSFFRFLHQTQGLNKDLLHSVPTISVRKKCKLPECLKSQELKAILDNCNRESPIGLRNYAVLMLLIYLGLRASEICNITLDDLNWDMGEIIIRGKGSTNRFPINEDLGNAIVDYLLHGRPKCSSRALFITAKKPYQGLQTSSAVSGIQKVALKHAGLNPKKKGAHLLRHSFAMELLRQGATLYEIGAVLRHKDIGTTAIYAKVDFEKLAILATPWPIKDEKGGLR